MHVYITSRNLLSVIQLAEQLADQRGVTGLTVIDCGSSYRPLFDQYPMLPAWIDLKFVKNLGPRAAWAIFEPIPPYVVTDGDLSIADWPADGLQQLKDIAAAFPQTIKVGAALRIDDLPQNSITEQVVTHERQFWTQPLAAPNRHLYSADIDTTLAVYNTSGWCGYGPAIRHGGLQARHLPWYIDPTDLPKDYQHNLTQDDHKCTHWTAKLQQQYQQQHQHQPQQSHG